LGKFQVAAAEYRAALRISPELPGGHFLLGKSLMQLGESNEAIGEFRAELGNWSVDKSRIPNEMVHEAHMDMATALLLIGRNQEALEEFQTIANVEPRNSEARNSMGLILANLRRDPEAIEEY
jgi:Flp pilus assembly protein TadD